MAITKNSEAHPFKDFLPRGVKFLVIGSFPGPRRIWKIPWFYGSRYSQFWKIMDALYGSSCAMSTLEGKKALFRKLRIGLTDIFRKCSRTKGDASDTNLIPLEFGDIPLLFARHPMIKNVFFTSSFVAKFFKKFFKQDFKEINFVTLPSPSPRFAKMSLAEKTRAYRRIFPKV